jgi:predicted lipoprotein with Yx(FWY)xxD motif
MFKTCLIAAAITLATTTVLAAGAPAAPANGVLATPSGATVYTFDENAAGSGKSACNGPCARAWPPVAAQASDSASGDWTVVTRDDGSKQWAYKGWPLHTDAKDAKDAKPGDMSGHKFKDVWHVVKGGRPCRAPLPVPIPRSCCCSSRTSRRGRPRERLAGPAARAAGAVRSRARRDAAARAAAPRQPPCRLVGPSADGRPPMAAAAAVLLVLAAGGAGWGQRGAHDAPLMAAAARAPDCFAARASMAHAVYVPEVKRPVEVDGAHEDQLVTWLSKRMGAPMRAPHLQGLGYALEGGRLPPGERGPVAQFM